jgi:NAD-specific glutamate dehydrogenase
MATMRVHPQPAPQPARNRRAAESVGAHRRVSRLLLRRCRAERRQRRQSRRASRGGVQHFRLGEVRAPKQPPLALYTPDFDRHGWHSPHTVIDVVTDDMPFPGRFDHHGGVPPWPGDPSSAASAAGRRAKRRRALQSTRPRGAAGSQPESWIHLEIDRIGDAGLIDTLHQEIAGVLADVRAAVEDGAAMQQRMREADDRDGWRRVAEATKRGPICAGSRQQLRLSRLCRLPRCRR